MTELPLKPLIFLILLSGFAFAQNKNISVTDLKPGFESQKFPQIHYKENPKVAEKINDFLQVNELSHLPGVFKKHPFEKVAEDTANCCSYVDFQDWKQFATPVNILSLSISGEGMGAYPEGFETYRNFDLRTGNPVLLEDILTEDGIKKLAAIINDSISNRIRNQIKELKANPDYYGSDPENKDDIKEAIDQYEECLDDVIKSDMHWNEYYFSNDSIVFVRGRCFNHAMRALDDLDWFFVRFSHKQIDTYLTPTGKTLVYGGPQSAISKIPAAKIYKGFLGKYAITLMVPEIDNKNSSFTAQYWYDKKKIPIEWSGKYNNGHFSMTEYGGDENHPKAQAVIEADWSPDGKITGTWNSNTFGKVLKLELSAY